MFFCPAFLTGRTALVPLSITVRLTPEATVMVFRRRESPMPACARRDIVEDDQVGVYHCIARCVRRAFLCGLDAYSGRDYSHRKEWILERLRKLAGLFGIEICSYTLISTRSGPESRPPPKRRNTPRATTASVA